MNVSSAALVVVDMQNGFVNHHSRHAVSAVSDVVAHWSAANRPVVFTRYFNYHGSPYERFFQWNRLQGPPETDIVTGLAPAVARAYAIVDKTEYTLFTPGATDMLRQAGWTDLVFCGIATESCVLKSAADAFEHGHAPWIVTDACASDAGPDVHHAGLVVARRLIGGGQLVTTEHVVAQLAAHAGESVLEKTYGRHTAPHRFTRRPRHRPGHHRRRPGRLRRRPHGRQRRDALHPDRA